MNDNPEFSPVRTQEKILLNGIVQPSLRVVDKEKVESGTVTITITFSFTVAAAFQHNPGNLQKKATPIPLATWPIVFQFQPITTDVLRITCLHLSWACMEDLTSISQRCSSMSSHSLHRLDLTKCTVKNLYNCRI